jgi:hypothetical protein
MWGACAWLVVLVGYKLLPLAPVALAVGAAVAALLTLAGLAAGLWRTPTLLQTARWVDDRHHFQERLSTALEVAREEKVGHWRDLVVADAAERARTFDVRRSLPFHLPRWARWSVPVLALAAGLGFVPEYRTEAHRQRASDAQIIRETGRQLTELTRRQLETRPPALESSRAALESVKELGQHMGKVQLNRTEALKELASAADRIQEQLRELGREPGMRKLNETARSGAPGNANTPEGLQRQLDALQEQLGKQAGQSDALEQLKQELGNLQQAASAMAQADSAAADAMKQQIAQSLSDLANRAAEMGLDVAGLDEAIQSLAAAKFDQVLKDLDLAAMDLEKLAQMARAMKDLQKQLAEMGKDLAEQLEKGQGLAAYSTLKRMIRELEKADLSKEQLDQLLAEVDRAVRPGSEYGQVGEFLKEAVRQLRQNQQPGAAESLAQAADELKRLMDQLGDCEGLMAALEGLKMGQMCVGNGMAWGLCRAAGARPGFKPGGRPGAGVGTWADEGLWMDPEDTGLWDNSGVQRPDMDARGLADRGDGQLNEALTPTRVRGQLSPGGPMPSITLRGVSIRGESRVDYEERVTAAQSEAQSALSQDQVPRAYRGAVRDYFDDMK